MNNPQQFASDNYSGICPEAFAAMAEANLGHAPAYGEDAWTAKAADTFRALFETPCEVFFAFNGTAANSLALAALCQSYHSVICAESAHVETDECGAPEFFSNGSKLLVAPCAGGTLTAEDLRIINFRQADAELYGLEAEVKYAINENIDVSVFGDYVRARLTGSDNLPRIPPGRLGGRIDARHEGFSAFVQFYHVFGQGHVAPVETTTPGFNILNAGIAYSGQFNPINTYQAYLRANNLLNERALMHTSFIKNAAPLPGINLTLGTRFTF